MASGGPPGDAFGPPSPRRPRRPEDGLRALGDRIDRPRGSDREGSRASRSEERLRALGERAAGRPLGERRQARPPVAGGRGGRPPGRPGPPGPPGPPRPGGRRWGRRWRRWSTRKKVLVPLVVVVVLALALAGALYGYASYRFGQLPRVAVAGEVPVASGQPFNMLVVGSDSRLGQAAGSGFGTSSQVTGQRSDVIMVWHVVPATRQITITSIPRDTMVQMVGADVATFGRFNRINAAYNSGPSAVVRTIESNFGIPISHVVEVNFGGFEGAVNALGGVYMDFPYPAKDAWSGLDITAPGCQLLNGAEALSVARSRHYQYLAGGTWQSTPIGDLGRIQRQDAFLKALVDAAKSKLNPLSLNAFLGSLPAGLLVDNGFSLNEVLRLALDFHSITPGTMVTQTLPTVAEGYVTPWGDVLFVSPSADHQMLAATFGTGLTHPTSPPPDGTLVPVTVAAAGHVPPSGEGIALAATTSPGASTTPSYDPTACRP